MERKYWSVILIYAVLFGALLYFTYPYLVLPIRTGSCVPNKYLDEVKANVISGLEYVKDKDYTEYAKIASIFETFLKATNAKNNITFCESFSKENYDFKFPDNIYGFYLYNTAKEVLSFPEQNFTNFEIEEDFYSNCRTMLFFDRTELNETLKTKEKLEKMTVFFENNNNLSFDYKKNLFCYLEITEGISSYFFKNEPSLFIDDAYSLFDLMLYSDKKEMYSMCIYLKKSMERDYYMLGSFFSTGSVSNLYLSLCGKNFFPKVDR